MPLKLESTLELDAVQVWGTWGCVFHLVFRDNVPIFKSLCWVWASLPLHLLGGEESRLTVARRHDTVFGLPWPSSRPMLQPLWHFFSFPVFAFTMRPKRWPVIIFFYLSGFSFWEVSQKTNFYCDWKLFTVKTIHILRWHRNEFMSSLLFLFFF